MHQYIETVRTEIEAAAGQEAYLASTIFLRIFRDLEYEDEGALKLSDKKGYETVQHRAVNVIGKTYEFDIKDEILGWQIGILRDIVNELYHWWIDYKDEKFRASDNFSDGEACMALEASCEKLSANPTDVYTALLEVEFTLTRLATSCNTVVTEMDRFWQFKYKNNKKDPQNKFIYKRIEAESKQTILYQSVEQLKDVAEMCKTNGWQLAGADHLLWMNPYHMLQSLIHALNGFVNFEYIQETDLSLSKWLDELFPKRLSDSTPNPLFQSGLHHKIIANLTQATQCMVQQTVRKKDVFTQRDEILRPYFYEALEAVKKVELQNLSSEKSDARLERQQK